MPAGTYVLAAAIATAGSTMAQSCQRSPAPTLLHRIKKWRSRPALR
jgi:hypothetical protein